MSLSGKLNQAESILRAHYRTAGGEDKTVKVIADLAAMGATSEESLAELTAPDLEVVGVPKLIARKLIKVLGGSDTSGGDTRQVVILNDDPVNLAARLKPEELVAEYDPNDPTSPFGTRLAELVGKKQFLVFDENNRINVPVSAKLIREILDGFKPRVTILVGGALQETFAVGERPARYADENPVIPGAMLRPDGMSDSNIEWGAIPMNIRQLLHIAVKSKEVIKPEIDLFEDINGKSYDDVARRFPVSAIEFKNLAGAQNLPALKLILSAKIKADAAPAAPKA